ncbi:MAG: hypothetical protein AAGF99_12080 [Bacteroidota bacterium]
MTWRLRTLQTYAYTSAGALVTRRSETYDVDSGELDAWEQDVYAYADRPTLPISLTETSWSSFEGERGDRADFACDAEGRLTEEIDYTGDRLNTRTRYVYAASDLVASSLVASSLVAATYQDCRTDDAWSPSLRTLSTQDDLGRITERLLQTRDGDRWPSSPLARMPCRSPWTAQL